MADSMRRPRAAIVGAGYIARRHAAALAQAGIPIAGVVSATPEHAADFAHTWATETAAGLGELLDLPGVTHVHVCTPTAGHAAVIEAAAARKLAIVCEKPLTTDAAVAADLVSTIDAAGVDAYVTFNRRYDEGIQRFRALCQGGEVGRVVSVYGTYQQEWNAPVSTRDWRFEPAAVGPSRVVSEIGSHWFDLASYTTGLPITDVVALTQNMGEREYRQGDDAGRFTPENEDAFAALFRFEDGAAGSLLATQLAHGAWDDIGLRVDGTAGSLAWSSTLPGRVVVAHKGHSVSAVGTGAPTASIETMIASIYAGGDAICARFDEAAANCAVQDAVLRSAAAGAWTTVEVGP